MEDDAILSTATPALGPAATAAASAPQNSGADRTVADRASSAGPGDIRRTAGKACRLRAFVAAGPICYILTM